MKRHTLYKRLFMIAAALLIAMLAACGGGTDAPNDGGSETDEAEVADEEATPNGEGKVVRIGYQKGNTLNILKESGFLEEALEAEGHEVEWLEFVRGGALMEGLFTGNIDFGHAADGPGIMAQAGNKPFYYVGADLPNPEGVGILVHADSGITSVEQLKGKSIGALQGGNHHYLALLAVQAAGLAIDDVEWVFLQDAAQMRSAFETKNIDALATYDPFFAGIEIDLDVVNLTEGENYGHPNRTFYFANVEFYEENKELVDTILNAIDRSDQWANENKEEAVKLVSEELGIAEPIIQRSLERREFGVERLNEEILEAQQKQADLYYEIGLIPVEIDVSERMIFE